MNDDDKRLRRLQAKFAKQDKLVVDAFIAGALEDYGGRKFLWWLLELGKFGQQPFSANALTTSFACGELNVGNQIFQRIAEVNAAGYVQLAQENLDEYRNRYHDGRDDNGNDGDD